VANVLRPACLGDIDGDTRARELIPYTESCCWFALQRLYDAEWRKRGFLRSP